MFPQGGNVTDISNFPFPSSFQNTETRYFVLCILSTADCNVDTSEQVTALSLGVLDAVNPALYREL